VQQKTEHGRKLGMTIFIVSNPAQFSDFMRGIWKLSTTIFIVSTQEVTRALYNNI